MFTIMEYVLFFVFHFQFKRDNAAVNKAKQLLLIVMFYCVYILVFHIKQHTNIHCEVKKQIKQDPIFTKNCEISMSLATQKFSLKGKERTSRLICIPI